MKLSEELSVESVNIEYKVAVPDNSAKYMKTVGSMLMGGEEKPSLIAVSR